MDIPISMKALQVERYEKDLHTAINGLRLVTKPVPSPSKGQVLIKVHASPCNPSDLEFLKGTFDVKKTFPATVGMEGAGTVVASGGGMLGWFLKGKRVAFTTFSREVDYGGCWAEYSITDSKLCVPLSSNIDFIQGSNFIFNPFTAIALLQKARNHGHKAIVQTAAASQLGKMIIRLALQYKMPLINIVRRPQQVDLLKSLGAQYVLNSEDNGFFEEFKALAQQLKVTCAFDAVGGTMTGIIVNGLPPESLVIVYGSLSDESCGGISTSSLFFDDKKIEGFMGDKWLEKQGIFNKLKLTSKIQKLIRNGIFASDIYKTVSLEEAKAALEEYCKEMTRGKVIIKPS